MSSESSDTGNHRSVNELIRETERLATLQYSVETQARIETLLWVNGLIDDDHCPSGSADDHRGRDLITRGSFPFDPSVEVDDAE